MTRNRFDEKIEDAMEALTELCAVVLSRPSPLFNPRIGVVDWEELPLGLIPQLEKNESEWWQNAQTAAEKAMKTVSLVKLASLAIAADPSIDANALQECVNQINRAIRNAIQYSRTDENARVLLSVMPGFYKPRDLPDCIYNLGAVARELGTALVRHLSYADAIPNSQPTTTTGVTTTTATTTDAAGATATGAKQQNGNAADAESVSTAHAKPSKTGQSPNSPGLLTVNEFAAVAKVSKKTIYRLCADEVAPLPHTRLGKTIRIDADKALRHLHHLKMDGHSDASEPQNRPSRVTKTGNRKFNPSRTIPGTGIKRRS